MNLIIFDIDGTMTQSENHHQSAFVDSLHALGIKKVNDDWASYAHLTDTHIFEENYKTQFGVEPDENTLELLEELIMSAIQEFVPPAEVPGAGRLVQLLKTHPDYCFAYATGSLLEPAKYKLDEAKIFYEEEIVIGANGLDTREEIVTAAIDAAKMHYAVPHFEHIISAGDGPWDMRTAKNLNLKFLGIGEKNKEAFDEANIPFYQENWSNVDVKYLEKILSA